MQKPRIAITCGPNIDKLPPYLKALEAAGAEGVAFQAGHCTADKVLSSVDGVLLPGGGDIDPALYAATRNPKVYNIDRDRDLLEKEVLLQAHARKIPLLGICRGEQVMAWAMGGNLYQDIEDEAPPTNIPQGHKYFPNEDFSILVHSVTLTPDSHLAKILGTTKVDVNSVHHQGVSSVVPPLRVVGTAIDGMIEAIEDPQHPWFIGVQWHPEWLRDTALWQKMFRDFVETCRKS